MSRRTVALASIAAALALSGCVGGVPSQTVTEPPPLPTTPVLPTPSATSTPSAVSTPSDVASPVPSAASGSGVAPAGSVVEVPPATIVVPPPTDKVPAASPPTPAPTPVPTATRPPVGFNTGVTGRALLGPVCPVMRDPPDPQCADRPVAGVSLTVDDASGARVAQATTDAQGFFAIELPAGAYILVPGAFPNAMHAAAPIPFTVAASGPPTIVDVSYDTGIR